MAAAEPHSDADEQVLNPDGSLARRFNLVTSEPTPTYDPKNPTPVLSKDIKIDADSWFRVYLPRRSQLDGAKLPVVFYFHGGGFALCSPDNTMFHVFCSDMAASLPALVLSLNYPLAPKHRLPAAYDAAVASLHWIKTNSAQVDWLKDHADFSNSFLMGNSAGANLAYHAGLRAAADAAALLPVKIKGLILHHPFFGSTRKTPSELRMADDPYLPPSVWDVMWQLALPVGADRDHEYCNPTAGGGSDDVERMRALGWRVLVTGFDGDALYDHQTAFAEMLERKGVAVETLFKEGGIHGIELIDAEEAVELHSVIRKFVTESSN